MLDHFSNERRNRLAAISNLLVLKCLSSFLERSFVLVLSVTLQSTASRTDVVTMITVVYTVHAALLFKGGGVEYAPGTAATCFSASLFRRTLWTIYLQ